ncbi:MAG: DEAD/DEAH box helicase family protein [Candidatus Riflebacteria bacterium]|nr:DEAD/DEAH box helicase family protein [Candidatus Riflebacteria bacterium]
MELLLPADGQGMPMAPPEIDTECVLAPAGRSVRVEIQLVQVPGPDSAAALAALRSGLSTRFVADAALIALDRLSSFGERLCAQGRVAPFAERYQDRFFPRWVPRPDHFQDTECLERLVRALPPSAGAAIWALPQVAREWQDPADPCTARAMVAHVVLEDLVDACMRRRLAKARSDGRLPASTTPAADSALASWLAGLAGPAGPLTGDVAALEKLARDVSGYHAALMGSDRRAAACVSLAIGEPYATPAGPRCPIAAVLLEPDGNTRELASGLRLTVPRGWASPQLNAIVGADRFDLDAIQLPPELAGDPLASRDLLRHGRTTLDAQVAARLYRRVSGTVKRPPQELPEPQVLGPPSWRPDRLSIRLVPRLEPVVDPGGPLLGLDALCRFDWQVALGGTTMSLEAFRALVDAHRPLVEWQGQYFYVGPDLWTEIEALPPAAAPSTTMTLRAALERAGRLAARVTLDPPDMADWMVRLRNARGLAPPEPSVAPDGFEGTLRPYQARGVAWIQGMEPLVLGACLADDMGLGKTVQVLAWLVGTERNGRRGKALLVVPTAVITQWEREASRFAPGLRVAVHHGPRRARESDVLAVVEECDLLITSYSVMVRDRQDLARVLWDRVILDEAHTVRSLATQGAAACRVLPARFRLALTGTPIQNRSADLFALLDYLNPGLLGSSAEFRRRYGDRLDKGQDQDRATELRNRVAPFLLRRRKSDPLVSPDLPPREEMVVLCRLTVTQAACYQAVLEARLAKTVETRGAARQVAIFELLLRLKQVCDHPALLPDSDVAGEATSGKLDALDVLVEEAVEAQEAIVVFTQFRAMAELVADRIARLTGRAVLVYHGGLDRPERDAIVQAFQDGLHPVLVATLMAGGTGLNLTAARHVVHLDRWWNPAVEDQASDRVHRLGQAHPVQVRKLVCVGTLEERIDSLIERKRGLAGDLLVEGDRWVGDLDDEALVDLVRLGAGEESE